MPKDEPEIKEIIHGVANRINLFDIGAAIILILTGTIYAVISGFDFWWLYAPILVIGIFVLEAGMWYYSDYRSQLLKDKTKILADGEDVNLQIDTGPGLTSPYNLAMFGSIIAWGLISIHLFRPVIGKYPATFAFLGGSMGIMVGITLLIKKNGEIK